MSQVFISYDHADGGNVHAIRDVVATQGHTPWFDGQLTGGERDPERIERKIRRSLCLVVILSEASLSSEWVKQEVEYAQLAGKPIVPLARGLDPAALTEPEWAVRLQTARHIIRYNHNVGPAVQRALGVAIRWTAAQATSGRVVSFVNFKGGVGKTTLCALTGFILAKSERRRVLFVDLDPQENLSDVFLTPEVMRSASETGRTALSLFEPIRLVQPVAADHDFELLAVRPQKLPRRSVQSLPVPLMMERPRQLAILPSDFRMVKFCRASAGAHDLYRDNFTEGLQELKRDFDLVLVDCGPAASLLSHCALSLADKIVAPVQPNDSATRGLVTMNRAAREVFGFDIHERVAPLFNFVRPKNVTEANYVELFRDTPERVSADLGAVLAPEQTFRQTMPQADPLLHLNSFLKKQNALHEATPLRRIVRRMGKAGPAAVAVAEELLLQLDLEAEDSEEDEP
ncbi:MAG: AAA family ATPase [Myxococcales bacterium]|nr:AAA family ATPase [Myxococcales bacterium]